jgi:FHA domain-containing protein
VAVASEPEPSSSVPSSVTWRLRVDDPQGNVLVDRALEGRRYLLGRDKRCDVCLQAREISREHAALERDDLGHWWLVDLGSTSGTFVNGRLVSGRRVLAAYDVAHVGEYRIELHVSRPPSRPAIVLPVERTYEAPARVRVCNGRLAGRDLRLDRGRLVVGEGPDSSLALEGRAYEGVRVVIRPLKDGTSYEVRDESASPSLTVDGQPARVFRLDAHDATLGLGPVEQQGENARDAFCLRYSPNEHLFDEATPAPLGALRVGGAAADLAAEQAVSAAVERHTAEVQAAAQHAAGALDDAAASPGGWPDLDFGFGFGEPLDPGVRTVELKRPANLAPPGVGTPTPGPAEVQFEPPAPAEAAKSMGKTIVHQPAEKEASDEAPLSISTFVRQIEAARRSSPDIVASASEAGEVFEGPAFDAAEHDVGNRTLKLSEPGWPAQREALRARAEAAPRHRWLPGAAFVLLLLALLAPLVGVRCRAPSTQAADGAVSSAMSLPAPPPAAASIVAPEPTAPPSASAARGAARPPPARGAWSARGVSAEGAGPQGKGAGPKPRKRAPEICERSDCSR